MEPFFTSKACPELKITQIKPVNITAENRHLLGTWPMVEVTREQLEALYPTQHAITQIGGHSGKLLELLALGNWLTNLDAQGYSSFADRMGIPYATSGDKRLREVRTELGNYEIAIQEEKVTDNGKPHKRWRVHPADLKRLQTYLGM